MGLPTTAAVGAVAGAAASGLVALARRGLGGAGRRTGGPAAGRPPEPGGRRGPRARVVAIGTGRVTAPPDVLTLDLGVQVTTDSARAALAAANERAAALLAVLAEHGVAGRDVVTHGLSVHPEYGPDGERPRGYTATNQVRARLRHLERAGELVDAAVSQVGDHVLLHGLVFGIDDPTPVLVQARRQAVEGALAEAGQLAAAAGRALGPVLSIAEGVAAPSGPGPRMMRTVASGAPIEAGEQHLEVTVTVEVALAWGDGPGPLGPRVARN